MNDKRWWFIMLSLAAMVLAVPASAGVFDGAWEGIGAQLMQCEDGSPDQVVSIDGKLWVIKGNEIKMAYQGKSSSLVMKDVRIDDGLDVWVTFENYPYPYMFTFVIIKNQRVLVATTKDARTGCILGQAFKQAEAY